MPSLTLAHIASRCRTRCFDSNNASHCPASPSSTSHLKTKNAPFARRVMFSKWWWEVDSTAAHRADEREHRRPQVEKRKATTSRNTLPSQDGGATRRDKEKTLSKQSFETAYFYLSKSVFRQHIFKMVVGGGFEPPKAMLADLQSAPFSHSGIPPVERVRGVEPL